MSDKTLSESDFKAGLDAAIDQRTRQYASDFSLHIRFEDDDTRADKDATHFQSFLRALRLSVAEELVIKPSEPVPGWKVGEKFQEVVRKAVTAPGRNLVVAHYAGHGGLDDLGRLVFFANRKKSRTFQLQAALLDIVSETSDFDAANPSVDIVFIIDSCYSGSAVRNVRSISRIVEILAACEADTTAFGNDSQVIRTQNRTFTSKLADYVSREKGRSSSVELAGMVSVLRSESPVKKPIHRVTLGPNSIRLPFPGQDPTANVTAAQSSTTQPYRVLMSVHISDSLTADKLKELVEWIFSLDKRHGLSVESVYNTNFTGLLLEVPYALYSKMQNLPGVRLIFEHTSGNLLPTMDLESVASRDVLAGKAPFASLTNRPLTDNTKSK